MFEVGTAMECADRLIFTVWFRICGSWQSDYTGLRRCRRCHLHDLRTLLGPRLLRACSRFARRTVNPIHKAEHDHTNPTFSTRYALVMTWMLKYDFAEMADCAISRASSSSMHAWGAQCLIRTEKGEDCHGGMYSNIWICHWKCCRTADYPFESRP
ncbi:hypothetical protein B0H34DRAFT_190286 [Crassisporium funariophilum]|nr:hypothetical protein B0H34DRAFT_190286 [Crassisporium funariophilum]